MYNLLSYFSNIAQQKSYHSVALLLFRCVCLQNIVELPATIPVTIPVWAVVPYQWSWSTVSVSSVPYYWRRRTPCGGRCIIHWWRWWWAIIGTTCAVKSWSSALCGGLCGGCSSKKNGQQCSKNNTYFHGCCFSTIP